VPGENVAEEVGGEGVDLEDGLGGAGEVSCEGKVSVGGST
jgi:hypothetical protein